MTNANHQKQLWLDGAPLEGPLALPVEYTLVCPCCVGLDGIDSRGSPEEWDVLEDMGFSGGAKSIIW